MTTDVYFWDRIARKYAKQPVRNQSAYEHTLERTRSYLLADAKVLELGCGTGSTALLLASNIHHITATDVSPEMIAIAREKSQGDTFNAEFVVAASDDSQFDDSNMDTVLAHNLLHLLRSPSDTIARAHAALKPGGYFISKTPCLGEKGLLTRVMVAVVRAWMRLRMRGAAPFVNFLTIRELEDQITRAGFDIVESGDFPPPSRYIVARKR